MAASFVAIDLEAAANSFDSVCSIGAIRVENGQLVDQFYTLINPQLHPDAWSDKAIKIHGIRPVDVATAPLFPTLYWPLRKFIGDLPLVAHSMHNDIAMLHAMCIKHRLPKFSNQLFCSLQLAEHVINTDRYAVCALVEQLLPQQTFNYHNALADAEACALLTLRLLAELGVTELSDPQVVDYAEFLTREQQSQRSLSTKVWHNLTDRLVPYSRMRGEKTFSSKSSVAVIGEFKKATRAEILDTLNRRGIPATKKLTDRTTSVVVGQFPTRRPSNYNNHALANIFLAEKTEGRTFSLITEEDFWKILNTIPHKTPHTEH